MIVHAATKDDKGNKYAKSFFNKVTDTVICLKGQNNEFEGKLNFGLRRGKSKYGQQIVLQFIITSIGKNYVAKSEHDHIEFYLPSVEGVKFFEEAINKIGGQKMSDEKDFMEVETLDEANAVDKNIWRCLGLKESKYVFARRKRAR